MDEIIFIPVAGLNLIKIAAGLADTIWRPYYTQLIGEPQVDYMLEKFQSEGAIAAQIKEGTLYFLIAKQKEYIGYLAVTPETDQNALFLSKVYLKKNQRKKGYGRKAVEFIEDLASQHGLGYIRLTVNKNNIDSLAAYEKMRFKRIRSLVQDIGGGFVMDDYEYRRKVRGCA